MRVDHRFDIPRDGATVWHGLADVPGVVACVPGARVVRPLGDGRYDAAIGVRYGAIGLEFSGVAEVSYDLDASAIRIRATGRDRSGATRAAADLNLVLESTAATRTGIRIDGTVDLAGALAHVPAPGAEALVGRLIASFAERLAARVEGQA